MRKKNKDKVEDTQPVASPEPKLSYTFRVLNNTGPIPIARPSDFIQLTPAVQPVPIVPYTDQAGQFGGDENYDDEDYNPDEDFY